MPLFTSARALHVTAQKFFKYVFFLLNLRHFVDKANTDYNNFILKKCN